ncbi:putative ATP-dependent RNA helicase [uncultured archaeon]|nr:putative ATP-dependent RNA helicase [uncultured archaeon]
MQPVGVADLPPGVAPHLVSDNPWHDQRVAARRARRPLPRDVTEMGFTKLGLSPSIMKALTEMGFSKPTPIQEQGIPLLLQGEDLIGQAQTGTGKTAAFGICILERLAVYPSTDGRKVRALVLAPTRELAVQITGEIQKIGKHLPVRTLAVYGGQDIEKQLGPLHAGVDIVVGTPGRLLDHIERGTLKLENVEVVVLDEADRMLDMGFIEDIEKILKKTPASRQTLLFSATMPAEIAELSKRYLKSPQEVRVSEDSLSVKNIRQYYVEVSKFDRLNALLILLAQKKPSLALIFVRTKRGAERLNDILADRGFHSLALHGDMSQNKRDRSMEAFRKKHINILVATDLASRGLDVTDVSHVINFDTTDDPYTYVHRIGRTGRMGKEGEAISFIFFDQSSLIGILEKVADTKMEQIKIEIKPELMPKRVRFTEHTHEREGSGRGGHGRPGAGGFSRGGPRGPHGGEGRGGREGGFGDRRGGRGGRRRDSHRESTGSREYSSRGHQYFGRRG